MLFLGHVMAQGNWSVNLGMISHCVGAGDGSGKLFLRQNVKVFTNLCLSGCDWRMNGKSWSNRPKLWIAWTYVSTSGSPVQCQVPTTLFVFTTINGTPLESLLLTLIKIPEWDKARNLGLQPWCSSQTLPGRRCTWESCIFSIRAALYWEGKVILSCKKWQRKHQHKSC